MIKKSRKSNLVNKVAFVLIVSIIFISGCTKSNLACVNEKCYKVEIVDSSEERKIGLMEHETLGIDEGMFFIFDNVGIHSIWMKDMNFPIDIIWLDENYNVVDVKRDASPCIDQCEIYSPSKNARYVLEVNINSNVNIGDKVEVR